MNHRPTRSRNARLFLLIAALAHVLGGDFGAWLHQAAVRYEAGITVYAPGTQGDRSQAPAHPRDCAICQTLANGTLALPGRGIALRAAIPHTIIPGDAPREAPRYLAAPPSLPRGPPALS